MANRILVCLSLAAQWITFSMASVLEPAFSWAINDTSITSEVSQCSQISMHLVDGGTGLGVPPYFMIAAVPNGTSIIGTLGSSPSNLIWQVNYPSGTKFLPLVIDAHGNSGGVQNTIFFVTEGGSSDCLLSPSETSLTLSANVSSSSTDPIDACQPIDFTVADGTPPYTISIAALGQNLTNFTFVADTKLTWFDTANPNSEFIAIVSDANGPGRGTGFFKTTGSGLRTCPEPFVSGAGPSVGSPGSLVSSPSINVTTVTSTTSQATSSSTSGHSSLSSSTITTTGSSFGAPSTSPTRSESSNSSSKPKAPSSSEASRSPVSVSTMVGAAVGAVCMLFIGVTVLLCCYCRRCRNRRTKVKADQWIDGSRGDLDRDRSHPSHRNRRYTFEDTFIASESNRPVSVTFSSRSGYTATVATITSSIRDGWRNMRTMIQHQDAGDIASVPDLPPPYRDRRIVRDGTGLVRSKGSGSRVHSRRNEDAGSGDFSSEAIHHQM